MIIPRGIGFPHSDISGSLLTYCYPKSFVVRHVLHRLLVSSHSPCFLFYLTYFKLSFSLVSVAIQSVFFDCLYFFAFDYIQFSMYYPFRLYVSMEANGIEPMTSCVQSRRSPI